MAPEFRPTKCLRNGSKPPLGSKLVPNEAGVFAAGRRRLGVDLDFIAADKPQAAVRFVSQLEQRYEMRARFPRIGIARDDLLPSLRVFVFRGYGIYFRELEEVVRIERVLGPGLGIDAEQF